MRQKRYVIWYSIFFWAISVLIGFIPIYLVASNSFELSFFSAIEKSYEEHYMNVIVFTLVIASVALADAFEIALNTSMDSLGGASNLLVFIFLLGAILSLGYAYGVETASPGKKIPQSYIILLIFFSVLIKVWSDLLKRKRR